MSNAMFKGIMPALITPFENGEVKEDALKKLMKWQLDEGVDGFYICGTTGEGPVLRAQTRMQMAEIVVDETKGKGVVIDHIGAPNIEDALELTKHATDIKVDAIASLPPTYFFKYTEDELFDYYKLIADNTNLPVLVYATGMMGSVNVVRLMERVMKLGNVIGVKCTIRDYYMMRKIREVNSGDINLINGPDETLLCGLTVGADGGIGSTYNLMPDWFSKLYEAYASGNLKAAQDHQFQINRVIDVLLKYGVNGVNKSLKAALEMKGFDVGGAAFPAKKIEGEEKSSLKKDLENLGIKFEV
jgi:N-acetylneuraminate lyase